MPTPNHNLSDSEDEIEKLARKPATVSGGHRQPAARHAPPAVTATPPATVAGAPQQRLDAAPAPAPARQPRREVTPVARFIPDGWEVDSFIAKLEDTARSLGEADPFYEVVAAEGGLVVATASQVVGRNRETGEAIVVTRKGLGYRLEKTAKASAARAVMCVWDAMRAAVMWGDRDWEEREESKWVQGCELIRDDGRGHREALEKGIWDFEEGVDEKWTEWKRSKAVGLEEILDEGKFDEEAVGRAAGVLGMTDCRLEMKEDETAWSVFFTMRGGSQLRMVGLVEGLLQNSEPGPLREAEARPKQRQAVGRSAELALRGLLDDLYRL
ncbi:hypothetical protein BDZ85DRAFT_285337 [Elsinoe ampelina]|uniref:Uncharacterized protein n=1 Tax=Elsinoe ampelina TaxID=302913 RepID=A0A6A6G189_9PEZI|nr:hypothetical protein BDZ85DRAFT_285337 [Elsinoe ampelina]